MKIGQHVVLGAGILLAALIGGASYVKAQGFFDNTLIGQEAPEFTLEALNGAKRSLHELIKGKKAIVFFWATWCPHCREQISMLTDKKDELAKNGVVVILVDIGESKKTVERFLHSKGIEYPVLLDEENLVAETYQVLGVPTIVYIGDDGKVRESMHAFPDEYMEILK